MLTLILVVGGILLYLVLGIIVMFPISMLTWCLSVIFNRPEIARKDSDIVYIICVSIWPIVLIVMLSVLVYERIRYGK